MRKPRREMMLEIHEVDLTPDLYLQAKESIRILMEMCNGYFLDLPGGGLTTTDHPLAAMGAIPGEDITQVRRSHPRIDGDGHTDQRNDLVDQGRFKTINRADQLDGSQRRPGDFAGLLGG